MKLCVWLLAAAFAVGAAEAAEADLTGSNVVLPGSYKMKFEDGSATLECPKQAVSLVVVFGSGGVWNGGIDGTPLGGTWRQKGRGGRKVKLALDAPSVDVLNQSIDDAVSSCIASIPDGRPVRILKTKIKGRLNRRGDRLAVKAKVVFRSRETGFFWNMRGDDKDVFSLKAKGMVVGR